MIKTIDNSLNENSLVLNMNAANRIATGDNDFNIDMYPVPNRVRLKRRLVEIG